MERLECSRFLSTLGERPSERSTGNGTFVLVTGEAVIGKTVLPETFRERPSPRRQSAACGRLSTSTLLRPVDVVDELASTRRTFRIPVLGDAESPDASPGSACRRSKET